MLTCIEKLSEKIVSGFDKYKIVSFKFYKKKLPDIFTVTHEVSMSDQYYNGGGQCVIHSSMLRFKNNFTDCGFKSNFFIKS